MADGGNRERGAEFKSSYRSDLCSRENQQDATSGSGQVNQRFPASRITPCPEASTAAWKTHSHLHGGSSFSNGYDEPEMKRQRRIAKYKAYAVESKLKASLRNGLRWVKIKCSELLHR